MMLEKDYEISRKAKKGYLGNVEEKEGGNFDMIFILPSSQRKIKSEIYHFDKEATLLNVEKDELEIEKARKKWKWFNYKGDYFLANNISASANYSADLVFRKKRITAKYNWWTGQYERKVKMLDKVKPRNESGKKYKFFGGVYEIERDSTILVMALNAADPKDKLYGSFDLLKSDNELNITVLEKVEFPYSMTCVYSQPLKDDQSESIENDDLPRDWILIYAPTNVVKNNTAPDAHGFEYLRITPEGKITERVKFSAPTVGWRIIDAYEKDNSVLIYGMGSGKESKFVNQIFKTGCVATTSNDAEDQAQANTSKAGAFGGFAKLGASLSGKDEVGVTQEKIDEGLDLLTYNSFVFCKLTDGKVGSKITEIDEVNEKAVCPPDMKKPLKFDGKMFTVSNVDFLSDKSIVLSIQDFKKSKSEYRPYIYKGMFLLHFTQQGELIKNYTVSIDQKGKKGFFNHSPLTSDMIPTSSAVYESEDKTKLNWILHIVKAIEKESSSDHDYFSGTTTTTTTYTPLYSIEYGNIDVQSKKASDFKTLGEDENRKYYLYPSHNVLSTNSYLYFFSETTRGDKMLISRLEKN
ncbi:MAG: hypothetical protein NT040_18865 [Bacteroidetes bacterium]|nr:hypothetical protein [Bacteroidota bacterium]